MMTVSGVDERLARIRQRIDSVSEGRPVTIVAVTKGFGAPVVHDAVAAGLVDIGENYAQELVAKSVSAPTPVRWHFIGAIQRNKVRSVARLVALWHTVDRAAVAAAISHHAPGAAVLVQVNLTGDEGRSGCRWDEAAGLVEGAVDLGLDVRGLMGVGPAGPAETARPLFARLAGLTRDLGLSEISMGMSGDLEVAVAEGSTMVRLGTALFGPRPDRLHTDRFRSGP